MVKLSTLIILSILSVILYKLIIVYNYIKKRLSTKTLRIGILLPSCNSAGGGEKVLWTMLLEMDKVLK